MTMVGNFMTVTPDKSFQMKAPMRNNRSEVDFKKFINKRTNSSLRNFEGNPKATEDASAIYMGRRVANQRTRNVPLNINTQSLQ